LSRQATIRGLIIHNIMSRQNKINLAPCRTTRASCLDGAGSATTSSSGVDRFGSRRKLSNFRRTYRTESELQSWGNGKSGSSASSFRSTIFSSIGLLNVRLCSVDVSGSPKINRANMPQTTPMRISLALDNKNFHLIKHSTCSSAIHPLANFPRSGRTAPISSRDQATNWKSSFMAAGAIRYHNRRYSSMGMNK